MIRMVDRRAIESVLQMGSGYVLDFSDRTFAEFFREHGVDIEDERYCQEGTSKANRLRSFLRRADPPLAGQVLAALLEYRLAHDPDGIDENELERYQRVVQELSGEEALDGIGGPDLHTGPSQQVGLGFDPGLFHSAPIDEEVAEVMVGRMEEARKCVEAEAYLSAVMLCGSVLEGLCLGYGLQYPEEVNRAFLDRFNREPPNLRDWRLSEWVDVLMDLDVLSPNVGKFGHGVREFRNFIHPAKQVKHDFSPDHQTAHLSFQVVIGAVKDVRRAVDGDTSDRGDGETEGELDGLACPECGAQIIEGETRTEADWTVDGDGNATPDPYPVSVLRCPDCDWETDVRV